MSKQSDAKKNQGYRSAAAQQCANCAHYTSRRVNKTNLWGYPYVKETARRCEIGGFAVKRTAICDLWRSRDAESEDGSHG